MSYFEPVSTKTFSISTYMQDFMAEDFFVKKLRPFENSIVFSIVLGNYDVIMGEIVNLRVPIFAYGFSLL